MSDEQIKKSAINKGRAAVEKKAKQLARMEVVYVAIDSVLPNDYNPNRQDEREFELLKASMREDGFTAPIVVQRATNHIVDGEHRWRAARDIGILEIPVVFTDMTREQMMISTLRHNRAVGSHDADMEADVLRDLQTLGSIDWAQEALGIDDKALEKMLADVSVAEALGADIEAHTEAWVPTKNAMKLEGNKPGESVSMTAAAETVQKSFEVKIKAAKSEEERTNLEQQQNKDTFRLIVVLNNEDAILAKTVLDPNPAVKILELCKARYAAPTAGEG